MSNTTIFNLSDLNISTGRINVKSKKNNLVSVYSNTITKYYSATVTNGLSIDNVVLYDGQDNTGTQLGVLLMGETETYTITSGYIFAEWDNPLTIGDISFTSDDSDVGNPLRVNANKTLGLSVVTTYITFSSASRFKLLTRNQATNWDGTLYYSKDADTWNTWDGALEIWSSDSGTIKYLYIRGINNTVITGNAGDRGWVLYGTDISCEGNIENLLDYTTVTNGNHPTMANYCFRALFSGCTNLTTAPALPATTLKAGCYYSMFSGCTNLTTAPALPATTLVLNCYQSMFVNCTSLTTPAKMAGGTTQATSANGCCYIMYKGCTSLYIYSSASGHTAFYKALTYSTSSSATNYQSTYRMFYNCKINGSTSTTNYLTAGTQYYY